jgi:hypothetical protein
MTLGIRLCAIAVLLSLSCFAAELKTQDVFLIISDGFRWQEVFNGAERALISAENGVKNTNALLKEFWRDTPEARREALLPFIWGEIGKRGQILGNQAKGSVVRVSNEKNFSYPGYNEITSGIPDPRIDSNDKKPNPNTNVFEWLNQQPAFRGKVSVIGSWDAFPYIFNIERSHLPIWPAWTDKFKSWEIKVPAYLPQLMRDATPLWEDLIQDSFLFDATMYHLEQSHPRVLFVGFGETDEWAHADRYDLYLHAAHLVDDFVRRLWEAAQANPQYRDKTTFIITADHGRGNGHGGWTGHGAKVEGSDGDWIAVMGPDTPARGERTKTPPHTQAQLATTIAAFLGKDFKAASPKAASPILELIERQ